MFSEPREAGLQAVIDMSLPHYRHVLTRADVVLADPDAVFAQLGTDVYFVFLRTKGKKPVRKIHQTRKQVIDFIRKIAGANPGSWKVILSEAADVIYGGNVYVSREGQAKIEFRLGEQGPISAGTVVPEFRAWQKPFIGTWCYSFDDQVLRKTVYTMMREIAHSGHDYLPGMYEFQLIPVRGDPEILKPRFVDYRKKW